MDEAEFQALYGRWQPLAPREVRDLLAGSGVRWWIAGGYALELAGREPRPHDDVDVGIPFDDLPALRAHLAHLHLWEAHDGALRPLLPGEELREGREELWVRDDGSQPWLADVVLTPVDGDRWVFKKDARITLPLDEAVVAGDVPYLRPEIVLLHKAHLRRAKDEADLAAVLPLLDDHARGRLDDALALYLPDSPWRGRLSR
jgi:hypothetical protein